MSHFQRTRSKVWWGDSPPNIGSPVAQASNNGQQDDWAPQLPHYISPVPAPRVIVTPATPEEWHRRRDSPGSHKSQDSGFSDSDTSPPVSQYDSTPEVNNSKSSSNDSNNNENITVKNVLDANDNVKFDKSIDEADKSENDKSCIPKARLRSSSVIQTPYDFEKYIEVHCDEEHLKLFKDHPPTEQSPNQKPSPKPRKFIKKQDNVDIKIAKVKELDTKKTPDNNLEYIQVSDNDELVVNNKPRIRSPLTQASNDESFKSKKSKRHDFRRSTSYEHAKEENDFRRDKLNKSFGAVNNKQTNILDVNTQNSPEFNYDTMNFKTKTVDSLKIVKKPAPKAKHRTNKLDKKSCAFRIFPNRNKKNTNITNNTDDIENDWVFVGSNERLLEISNEERPKTRESKLRDKSRNVDTPNLDIELSIACMSTPKMLAPSEFMATAALTPKYPKKSEVRRLNLIENSSESKSKPQENTNNQSKTPLEQSCHNQPDSVQYWLCELTSGLDYECLTTLQSKPLGDGHKTQTKSNSATVAGNIKKVQTHGLIIVQQYNEVLRLIRLKEECEQQLCLTIANINEFVLTHSITLNTKPPGETPERWERIKGALDEYLQKLIDLGEDIKVELNETNPEWRVVANHLDSMVDIFAETIRAVQIQQLKTLVSIIEDPPSESALKSTLTSINHLMTCQYGTDDMTEKCQNILTSITNLPFVECEVPRALLFALIENQRSSIKALSLRALATICVSGEAVKQFDEGGGLEIISEILNDTSNPEPQLREAVTVLAQTTAPWVSGHYELTGLPKYMDSIIRNITAIISRTNSGQFLLLCAACLVNLIRASKPKDKCSNPDGDILSIMGRYQTVQVLLKRIGVDSSVFLKEQTALLINTISATKRGASIACGSYTSDTSLQPALSLVLVGFLRDRLPGEHSQQNETSEQYPAMARMIRYTCEALERLSSNQDFASQLIQLEAIPRLAKLVRVQKTHQKFFKSHSEPILIACLKALRAIYKHFPLVFRNYWSDLKDMVEPILMESILLFSSKQESYV